MDQEAEWTAGYGPITHQEETRARIDDLVARLREQDLRGDGVAPFELLAAADRLASAGMWLAVHQTYAARVYLDGRALGTADFKRHPEGHLGGVLNMVPAYVGYLTANALTGHTRAWLMGQGHCVGAIDSVNLLIGNTTPAHASRYAVTDEGLSRFAQDFYSYRIGDDGKLDSPVGSHVNAHTAGSLMEGGYLGFAELQYVHMPLPGERLVAFLSDGAFEEQRGSDWAPRWWRAEDSGLVAPIMIANGRRIDQRTTMSQEGGVAWFVEHLRLNGFDPIVFDGRDPAAFAWAVLEMEDRLRAAGEEARLGRSPYPVRLPYGIAVAPKGAGFYGEGTNLAHNLPLMGNPRTDPVAADRFNESARRLWVPPEALRTTAGCFGRHERSGRPREAHHALCERRVTVAKIPEIEHRPVTPAARGRTQSSPMGAVDRGFLAVTRANPQLRPRVGNPDEMRSNRLTATLEALKFRVTSPEPGVPEALLGAVITALNEEAVAAAALANKGGLGMVATYEAFAPKMLGLFRQEIIFTTHLREAGRPTGWVSLPLVLTSHTWENGKNEQSHQDPTMAEALLGETSERARVVFPADYNTAAVTMEEVFRTQAQCWAMVVPKGDVPDWFTAEEARQLVRDGVLEVPGSGHRRDVARVLLVAVGAYQLGQALRASNRLGERRIEHRLIYVFEPGRLRAPRSAAEAAHQAPEPLRHVLFPLSARARVVLTHTRPEPLLGVMHDLLGENVAGLGYIGHGGTADTAGMLFLNGCTWAHAVDAAAGLLGVPRDMLLDEAERAALDHRRSPHGVII
jgi:phosphoketolase